MSAIFKLRETVQIDRLIIGFLPCMPKEIAYLEYEMQLLENDPDMLYWAYLSCNPAAIHLLEANMEKIDWIYLSANPAAIHLLEANPEKIDWFQLSRNPNAIHLLEANPEKIHWRYLSENPAATQLLEANPDKIFWPAFTTNSSIFMYNYQAMVEAKQKFREELNERVYLIREIRAKVQAQMHNYITIFDQQLWLKWIDAHGYQPEPSHY